MLVIRQIIENPQDVIAVPAEFRHRPIEIIFMALDAESIQPSPLPTQNLMAETSQNLRVNWFEGYRAENDPDVLSSLPIDEAAEEWEW